ncbi:penicillin-binding protein 1C [Salinihabitans flavidus]|uniref:peptidoglycan glycosyltransferase n=1 Tax=Salinihabitans flavidus TaxID=569882 RepID=A0A1H8QUQ4_9RHOB|nr:penicillin-binding protein 1C [Salinihabitans flavidus]SEO57658.1 penicillin-binding protein 1C [Salinihabitans flavidus]
MKRHALLLLMAVLLAGAALRDGFDDWVDATDLPPLLAETSVEVRDRNGQLLRAYQVESGLWRLDTAPHQVDKRYLDMLIAYEDKRFRSHAGVDPRALLRAAGQALVNGQIVSGGSTLTMQVARLLEDGSTGQWSGKLRQMRVALALERRLSKDDILSLYLTHAPFGGNLEGLRAATLAWFGKEPTRLTTAEAALLIALPQSPAARRPDREPVHAQSARDRVVHRLQISGTVTGDAAQGAISTPLPQRRRPFPALAPHLSDRALRESPGPRRHDLTLDARLQASLERLGTEALHGRGERLSIALLVADHTSGEILATVGSAGYASADRRAGFVDMTRALRSPGSTLKPLIYALAFDRGLAHPETLIDDRPVRFGSYAPQNFDGQFRGEVRIADALRQSLNIPVILLTDQIGPARLMSALRQAGTEPQLQGGKPGLAVALGGVGMTLEDLVTLYAGIARGGVARPLHWKRDNTPSDSVRFLDRSSAWQVGHILSTLAPPRGAPDLGIAYKTGTSYGHRDAWAIGFDGRHVAGVWIGRPDGTPVPGAFGGDLAAPVLFDLFQRLGGQSSSLPPPPPETLMLDAARLPPPLRRFRGRGALFEKPADAPRLTFPPEGSTLEGGPVVVKVRKGVLPLSVLANGAPVVTGSHRREIVLPYAEPGAATFTVIDAEGRSDRVGIWVR